MPPGNSSFVRQMTILSGNILCRKIEVSVMASVFILEGKEVKETTIPSDLPDNRGKDLLCKRIVKGRKNCLTFRTRFKRNFLIFRKIFGFSYIVQLTISYISVQTKIRLTENLSYYLHFFAQFDCFAELTLTLMICSVSTVPQQ